MIITRTPVRIPLGGGGTDLPSYSSLYEGFLVSVAIDKYIYIAVNRRPLDGLIRASYSKTEVVGSVDELQHPLIREALRLVGIEKGIEITSIADVPAHCGLGTSGAFTVGLLNALHTFKRESVSQERLAEEASYIEMEVLGEPIGKQDQYLAALGGIICLEIDRQGQARPRRIQLPLAVLEDLERDTILFYTGLTRRASEVLADQAQATAAGDQEVVASLHQIKAIGQEVLAALESNGLERFGELLDAHWQAKRSLSSKITNSQIDRWYESAKASGALGGKLVGAGGGGFLMFYCNGSKEGLRATLKQEGLMEMPFRFDFEGSKVIVNL